MQIGKFHVDNRILAVAAVAALLVGLLLWPGSRPQDEIVTLHVDPQYNALQRTLLTSKTRKPRSAWGRRGSVSFNPQSVSLKSDGARFDAYVLDLAGLEDRSFVEFFLDASRRIEAGEQLEESSTLCRRLDVTEASFPLASVPFGVRANYMLIVYGKEAAEVTAVVSYGGGPAE
ncbi:MAG TPA: hypothetical protein VGN57_00830 [Pirellulaceae bacterium]|jgi:hypothetical protein|nr:hypothetical protein [Pirellulaceae bacterium]